MTSPTFAVQKSKAFAIVVVAFSFVVPSAFAFPSVEDTKYWVAMSLLKVPRRSKFCTLKLVIFAFSLQAMIILLYNRSGQTLRPMRGLSAEAGSAISLMSSWL